MIVRLDSGPRNKEFSTKINCLFFLMVAVVLLQVEADADMNPGQTHHHAEHTVHMPCSSDYRIRAARLAKSHLLTQQAVDSRKKSGNIVEATLYQNNEALREAEAGRFAESLHLLSETRGRDDDRDTRLLAAFVCARANDVTEAEKRAQALEQAYPHNTLMLDYGLPTIRAAAKLGQGDPAAAIELLRPATKYELAQYLSFDNLYPAYIRGLAYLQMKEGSLAAPEFQKLIDHPGIVGDFVTGAIAHLQLGRAQAMTGDYAAARKSYLEFLTLWRDVDPDLPFYKEAKAEYAALVKTRVVGKNNGTSH